MKMFWDCEKWSLFTFLHSICRRIPQQAIFLTLLFAQCRAPCVITKYLHPVCMLGEWMSFHIHYLLRILCEFHLYIVSVFLEPLKQLRSAIEESWEGAGATAKRLNPHGETAQNMAPCCCSVTKLYLCDPTDCSKQASVYCLQGTVQDSLTFGVAVLSALNMTFAAECIIHLWYHFEAEFFDVQETDVVFILEGIVALYCSVFKNSNCDNSTNNKLLILCSHLFH